MSPEQYDAWYRTPRGKKGRSGGRGAYRGARWHSAADAAALFGRRELGDPTVATAVFLPGGSGCGRLAERWLPNALPLGAFLAVAGGVPHRC